MKKYERLTARTVQEWVRQIDNDQSSTTEILRDSGGCGLQEAIKESQTISEHQSLLGVELLKLQLALEF